MAVNSNVSKDSASVDQQTIQDLSSTGRHQECLEACQKLLQSEAESPMAWKYAGKSLIALGQMENAQQCLKKAHQIAKSDPEIAKDIGNIFLILGRREDATAWYRKSLEIKNDYVPAIVKLANIKKQSGNNQEAANLYNQAIQTDPTLVEAYVGAAACTMALGNLDQAQTIATQAIGINQSIEGVNEILGVIYQNKRNFQRAITSYQKELDINPKSETSLLNLGLLLLQQGESAAAIKPLTRAAAINPSEQCSLLLAQAYQSVGNQKEAICEYQKIDFSKIQNKMIPFNLGLCLLNTGRNIDAIEAFKIAIKLDESFLPAWGNIGTAFMKEGRYQEALPVTQKVIEHDPNNPTAHMNLGGIYKDLGNLDQALASTLKSLELNPANPDALNNLGCIYQDLGNFDQALTSTLKSLELHPDNPAALINLSEIDRNLGNLDKALASVLKSLELKPEGSQALCKLGLIKMALGQTKDAKRNLLISIEHNNQECEAYYALSTMLETTEEAEELLEIIKLVNTPALTPLKRSFAEFALSNCFHKIKKHVSASTHLRLANKHKLIVSPSNANSLLQKIAHSVARIEPTKTTNSNMNSGKGRVFIVGMPRSGSTLLETILSTHPNIKDLGECRSLGKAIENMEKQRKKCEANQQSLNDLYSQLEPMDCTECKYTTDKQLYNYLHINRIATEMPAAKIIHCRRNPMDNILSMYRSNLTAGNNYTSNLEDSARVLIAQNRAMQIQKNRYPEKIFTFDYDQFVNAPELNLRKLLKWLSLEFNESYLHPEKSARIVNTASVMQARKPINNKAVGGWKSYESLLKPALEIIQESEMETKEINY